MTELAPEMRIVSDNIMRKAGFSVRVISDCVTSYDLKKMDELLVYYTDKGCEVMELAEYQTGE